MMVTLAHTEAAVAAPDHRPTRDISERGREDSIGEGRATRVTGVVG